MSSYMFHIMDKLECYFFFLNSPINHFEGLAMTLSNAALAASATDSPNFLLTLSTATSFTNLLVM